MDKSIYLTLAMITVPALVSSGHERFAKYRAIEAYAVRPGVMMMPRYTATGEICEVGIERLRYTSQAIILEPDLSRKEIDEIFDEVVPPMERGPRSTDVPRDMISEVGPTVDTIAVFQNVTLDISSEVVHRSRRQGVTLSEVVATVRWNGRTCQ